jgi:hypothetical protein
MGKEKTSRHVHSCFYPLAPATEQNTTTTFHFMSDSDLNELVFNEKSNQCTTTIAESTVSAPTVAGAFMNAVTTSDFVSTANGTNQMQIENDDSIKKWLRDIRIEILERKILNEKL